MKGVDETGLTERQQYWLEHMRVCEAAGKRISEYAAWGQGACNVCGQEETDRERCAARKSRRAISGQVVDRTGGSEWSIQLRNAVSVAFAGSVEAETLAAVLNAAAIE